MAGVVRWTFEDLTTFEAYEFEINPNEGGSPQYSKHINYENTLAPDGLTLVFEGSDEPTKLSWSGTILTYEHYAVFVDWFEKRHPILVTDDLERQFVVYITSYQPKRQRSALRPWKHTYQMEATVLDWPS